VFRFILIPETSELNNYFKLFYIRQTVTFRFSDQKNKKRMTKKIKKALREGFNELKKELEKITNPVNKKAVPQLVLQPVKNPDYLNR